MIHCQTCGQRLLKRKPVKSEDPAWPAFLDAWWNRYGSTPVPARELYTLPEARVVRSTIITFGQALGKAWRSGDVVSGRRVVLKEWGHTAARKKGNIVIPTTWALEEIEYNKQGVAS
jgi:hypothetical protein